MDASAVWALLINGGADPQLNYASHMVHLRELHGSLVERGMQPGRIAVFASDGGDPSPDLAVRELPTEPDAWLLRGTALERFLPVQHPVDTQWEGVELRPATQQALAAWVGSVGSKLGPDDTLLVYVTDHGLPGDDVPDDARIALWRESMDAQELSTVLSGVSPEVQVVLAMSQCYAGAFDRVVQERPNTCGFYASPAERPSYGCFPEGRARYTGHGARWIEALSRHDGLDAAHAEVVLTDRTPDVPWTSSGLWLRRRLLAEAESRGVHAVELADALLLESEPLAEVTTLAAAMDLPPPSSLSEVRASGARIPEARERLEAAAVAWDGVLDGLRADRAREWLEAHPREARALARLPDGDAGGRARVAAWLGGWLRRDLVTWDRVTALRRQRDEARQAAWRLAVREGWLLRMESALQRRAGEVLAEEDGALEALRRCEAVAPGAAPGAGVPEGLPDWPSLAADLALGERTLTPWLGVQAREVSAALREAEALPAGAVTVQTVFPDSPASRANIQPGDILLGPPDAPFSAPWALSAWTLTAPLDREVPLAIRRGDRTYSAWVAHSAPPSGHTAPVLRPGPGQRAPDLALGVEGTEHLLFFWATWCAPCKAAMPELLSWAARHDVPIVAITDEPSRLVRRWRRGWDGPFPERAVADPTRDAFVRYGVHTRPVFVHVGADGRVLAHQEGYSLERGLFRGQRLPGVAGAE